MTVAGGIRKLPSVRDEVLLVAQRDQVTGQVIAIKKNELELDLLQTPRMSLRAMEQLPAASLEYINDEGVARLHGKVCRVRDNSTEDGYHPHLVSFRHQARIQLLQRRQYVRADASLSVTAVAVLGKDAVATRGVAIDISGGGLRIRGLGRTKKGVLYDFSLELGPGEPIIMGQFRVVRAEDGNGTGVEFTRIADDDRQRLIKRAYALSRRQRRRIS